MVRKLLQQGDDVHAPLSCSRATPLHLAAASGSLHTIDVLLDAGASALALSFPERVANIEYTSFGPGSMSKETIEIIGKHELDSTRFGGCRAVEIAAVRGNLEVVKRLIGFMGGYSQYRWDALRHTIVHGDLDMAQALLDGGVILNGLEDDQGQPPMSWALESDSVAMMKLVLQYGAEALPSNGELEEDAYQPERAALQRLVEAESREA